MIQPRIRTLIRFALAAGGAGGLALGLSGPASAQTTGGDWAGYGADSSTYTSVSASWVQPTASCGSAASTLAFWVGLDGISSTTVEQLGTEMDCTGGKADYEAWYEMYPAAPVYLSQAVSPGDSLTATVSATTAGVFTLTLKDATAGWTFSTNKSAASALRSSAEVVVEAPALPATAGSVSFTAAKVNGASLGAANPTLFTGTGVSCGSLVGGTAFTCTWK